MRRSALLLVSALAAAGCLHTRARTPQPAGSTLVVLLPDPGATTVGRAVVSNAYGQVELSDNGAAATAVAGEAPRPSSLAAREVRRLFGAALDSLPPAPLHFVLFFGFDSEELTDESRRLVQDVLAAATQRSGAEVVVIGHTDTTGTPAGNVELGLRRAGAVRARLIEAGVPPALISVASHGEAAPLVRTGDDVSEPRNRRVEIAVR
jgi:outer membrane protein OmpA-like peptidoglycan-associated protein